MELKESVCEVWGLRLDNKNENQILDIIMAFHRETDYDNLLNVILTKMMEITGSDAGTLYMLENNQLHFHIVRNISLGVERSKDLDLPPIKLIPGSIENISAYAAINKEIIQVDDVYESEEFNFNGPKNYDKMTGYRTKSMLVIPLQTMFSGVDRVIGVIQLINSTNENGEVVPFKKVSTTPILTALANISANTLANVMHTHEIKKMFGSFVEVMTKAIDERSSYNKNHTYNVAELCRKFTSYLSERFQQGHKYHFDLRRHEQLVMSAYLHDIGKIITPLEVMDKPARLGTAFEPVILRMKVKALQVELSYIKNEIAQEEYTELSGKIKEATELIIKSNTAGFLPNEQIEKIKELAELTYTDDDGSTSPILTEANLEALTIQKGTLTDREREIMQEHVSITERLLEKMHFNEYYKDVAGWASGHHECLDGSGYPLGLSGEAVSIEMRILTIADIFDALTASDRPYRKSFPTQKALDILTSMVEEGKLHKELVDLFIESKIYNN
jgi:HD-GYP domain-containing protein (c-di-GMP phosphodiesterase class II)